MRKRSLRLLPALAVVLAAATLTACGDDASGDGKAATTAQAASAFPVTIESKLGSAWIDAAPQRVVALDYQSADDALALGVKPVAIAGASWLPGGLQEWTKAALGSAKPKILNVDEGLPFEQIAELKPDLILATNLQLDRKAYALLANLAPTVHFLDSSRNDSWEETMTRIGKALGRSDEAQKLVADTRADIAQAKADNPHLAEKTVTFFNADAAGIYVISDPQDYSLRFMGELGMKISPKVVGLKDVGGGRSLLSRERYDVADADVVVGTSPDPEALSALGKDQLFQRLEAVRGKRYVSIDVADATSIVYPSLLSVRHATESVVPKLAAAADGNAPAS